MLRGSKMIVGEIVQVDSICMFTKLLLRLGFLRRVLEL